MAEWKTAKGVFMKKRMRLFGFVALITALFTLTTLSMTACNNDDTNDPPPETPETPATPQPFNDITAVELVANIKIGWNLGNTLDACDHGEGWMPKNWTVNQMETAWNDPPNCIIPTTTKSTITAIKNAGFNAIRIPITWYKVVDTNYNIRSDWMARVTEIVNYAVDNDMYIIINTHHDEVIFKITNSGMTETKKAFQKIWEQIADNFKNYNEKLIFEGLNEPRTIGTSYEWSGGNAEERSNINTLHQLFVDTVRGRGGNNGKRFLIITPHAQKSATDTLNALTIPSDPGNTAKKKIIVSIHSYEPFDFAQGPSGAATWSESNTGNKAGVTTPIDLAYNKFVTAGTPVIIGEFGAWDKNNVTARAAWAEFYVSYARSKGIPCFWWDGGDVFKMFNRSSNTFYFPEIKTALMNGINNTPPPSSDPTIPKPITGNMGGYRFGIEGDGVSVNYAQAVWELSGTNITTAKTAGTKLVFVLSTVPTAAMQLVWQGPDNNIWWQSDNDILGNTGNAISEKGVTWNSDTKTLTIILSTALADYSNIAAQSSINIVLAYYGAANINDLGIVSANLQNP
jgi:endoglucanase